MPGEHDSPPAALTPTAQLKLQAYGQTDVGLMRSENEDDFLVDEESCVYAVADGLGGLPEGAMASEIAIQGLAQWSRNQHASLTADFLTIFADINREVRERGKTVSQDLGIGTTLTAAQLVGNLLTVGHIGDTALVVFGENSWHQVTSDHTMAQQMISQLNPGEEAYIPDYFNHTLTRCLGQIRRVKTDIYTELLTPSDRVLLFSDGVSKTLQMDELHRLVIKATSPKKLVNRIIAMANDRGGPDNATAIAIFTASA